MKSAWILTFCTLLASVPASASGPLSGPVTIRCTQFGAFTVMMDYRKPSRSWLVNGYTVWITGLGASSYYVQAVDGDARNYSLSSATYYEKCGGDIQPWLAGEDAERINRSLSGSHPQVDPYVSHLRNELNPAPLRKGYSLRTHAGACSKDDMKVGCFDVDGGLMPSRKRTTCWCDREDLVRSDYR